MIRPRVLLATTCRYPWVARLAVALENAGCHVLAICPAPGHPLEKLTAIERPLLPYNPWAPMRSLRRAIASAAPDVVVPCDDRVVAHLHHLHATAADDHLARCIERSLGDPAGFPITLARHSLLIQAKNAGVATPNGEILRAPADLIAFLSEHEFPVVLKVDGSWGGKGVRVARTTADVWRAYRKLRRRLPLLIVLKRWIADRDPFWMAEFMQKNSPMLSVQSHIQGRPANCAVCCWKGRVLASVAVEVLQTKEPNGPATIVRVVERPEMREAARALAQRLRMSGVFGLDFIIDEVGDFAHLIEMNPRATPLCHIQLGPGRDLPNALVAAIVGDTRPQSKNLSNNPVIAYFPDAFRMSGTNLLASAYHDIPWEAPELLEELVQPPGHERTVFGRLVRILMSAARRLSDDRH